MSLPFVPKKGEDNAFRFDDTPTYLFRLYAPGSAGTTTTERVSAPACHLNQETENPQGGSCNSDLLQLTPQQAAVRLRIHLRWKCQRLHLDRNGQSTCNLMSWSSSLLSTIQYGLYRHAKDFDHPLLSNIYLLMIDTRQLPKQTFLRDLDAIERYSPLEPWEDDWEKLIRWRKGVEYLGEYLTQGEIDIEGKCCQVSIQQLIDTGLFYLCPALAKSHINNWKIRDIAVCRIRGTSRDWRFSTYEVSRKQVATAISMALMGMEGPFAFPFAVMLLALQTQGTGNGIVRKVFRVLFPDNDMNVGDLIHDLKTDQMRELKQFRELMGAIRESRAAKESSRTLEQVTGSFQSLSVDAGALSL